VPREVMDLLRRVSSGAATKGEVVEEVEGEWAWMVEGVDGEELSSRVSAGGLRSSLEGSPTVWSIRMRSS
jgi:uncharacterized protein (DUF1786 family)